jgi:hypothetical protein
LEPEKIEEHQTIVATEIGRGINAFETSLRYLRIALVELFHSALVRSGGQRIDGDVAASKVEREPSERYGLLQMTDILLRNLDAKQVFNVAHSAWDFRASDDTGHRDTSRILASRVTRRPGAGPGYETRELTFKELLQATAFLKAVELRMADLGHLVTMGQLDPETEDDFDSSFAKIWSDDIHRWLGTLSPPLSWTQSKLEDDPIAL